MRLIVMGAGPIGGIIGGRLTRAGEDVTFVDVDAEHVAAIRENGLSVDVPDGAFNVEAPILFPQEIEGTFDIAFIAVRSNYTSDAMNTVLPHLSNNGLLVSLQNGINPPLLEEKVGPDRAVGVAIRMGSRRTAPGCVHTATRGHLYVGHLHGKTTPQLERLAGLLNRVIPTEITDNILGVLWSKLTYTCLGYFGSLADAGLATSCGTKQARTVLAEFLGEVVSVGRAAGARFIPLAEYDPPDLHPDRPLNKRLDVLNRYAESWHADDRKGPLRQMQAGTPLEVEHTLGYVVREAKRFGIETPLSQTVLEMIRELETGKRAFDLQNYAALAQAAKRG